MISSYTSQYSTCCRHIIYDLKTVQEVVGQHLVHACNGMQDVAHEREVDVLVELFHVGQGSSSFLQLSVHVSQSRTRCYTSMFADAVFSSLGQGGTFEKVYLNRLGDIWVKRYFWPISTNSGAVASMMCRPGSRDSFT